MNQSDIQKLGVKIRNHKTVGLKACLSETVTDFLKILLKLSSYTHYCTLSAQNLDTKEGGKKSHSRSLMGNFGKHKVSKMRDSFCWFMSDFSYNTVCLIAWNRHGVHGGNEEELLGYTWYNFYCSEEEYSCQEYRESFKDRHSQNQKHFCLTTSLIFISEEELLVF